MIFSRFFDVFGMFHDLLMSAWLNASVLCVRSTFGAPRSCAEPQPFDSSDFHQFFHPFALLFSCFFHFIIFYHILSYFVIFISIWLSWFTFIVFQCHRLFPFHLFVQLAVSSNSATWPGLAAGPEATMYGGLSGWVFEKSHQFANRSGYWSKPWHLVNPKIAGKWMFIPLELIIIGFDPPPSHEGVAASLELLELLELETLDSRSQASLKML